MATSQSGSEGNFDESDVPDWIRCLQIAIRRGHDTEAANVAGMLARHRIKCYIAVDTNLKVTLETKKGSLGTIRIKVFPWMSIGELKEKVYTKHHILPNLQRWIFNTELSDDDQKLLKSYGIDSTGKYEAAVYLYIRDQVDNVGWKCKDCTYINLPTRPGCAMCSASRPEDYVLPTEYELPESEKERLRKEAENDQEVLSTLNQKKPVDGHCEILDELQKLDDKPVIENDELFNCPVCFDEVQCGEGIKLRECFHTFCKQCLENQILNSETATIKCPYMDDSYSCTNTLLDREIKALSSPEVYEKYHMRSMVEAESRNPNTFHCKTIDCHGWCFYDDDANEFFCPICKYVNCLMCKAIHEKMDCKVYQDMLKVKVQYDEDARKTSDALEAMVLNGEAMKCPFCEVVIQKKGGCDWLCCSVCRQEICWVTRGPRWGPLGKYDTSGGCRCKVDGRTLCHEKCQNCH